MRAQTIVRGKRRTLVGLVRVNTQIEDFPRSALIAGKFRVTDTGRKVIVNTGGAPVQVRCVLLVPPCLDYSAVKGQVSPDTTQIGYLGGNAMTDEQISPPAPAGDRRGHALHRLPRPARGRAGLRRGGELRLRQRDRPLRQQRRRAGNPGINRGSLVLDGNIVFQGLIYAPNRNESSDWAVTVNGFAQVIGAISIDGQGGMAIGNRGMNLTFNANVFNRLVSFPNAGIVQNTWRDIPS